MEIPVHVHQAGAMPIGCDMSWEASRYKLQLIGIIGSTSFNFTIIILLSQKSSLDNILEGESKGGFNFALVFGEKTFTVLPKPF